MRGIILLSACFASKNKVPQVNPVIFEQLSFAEVLHPKKKRIVMQFCISCHSVAVARLTDN